MNNNAFENIIYRRILFLRLIWAMLVSSIFIYGFILIAMSKTWVPNTLSIKESLSQIQFANWGFNTILILVLVALFIKRLSSLKTSSKLMSGIQRYGLNCEEEKKLMLKFEQESIQKIVKLGYFTFISIAGLVFAFLFKQTFFYYGFSAVSLFLLALGFPKNTEKTIESLKKHSSKAFD